MSEILRIERSTLSDIGSAIREANKSSASMKVGDISSNIRKLPIYYSNISFNNETAKDIAINCDRPENIIATSNRLNNGLMQQLPTALKIGATEIGAAYYKDKIWLFGGWTKNATATSLSDTISYYDLNTNKIEIIDTKLPLPTSGITTVVYNNIIYLIAGYTKSGSLATISKFDPETQIYSTLDLTLSTPLVTGSTILDEENEIIYLTTGDKASAVGLESIYKIDLINNTVETLDVALNTGVYYSAGAARGTRLYLFGGKTDANTTTTAIQWFDYSTMETGTLDLQLPVSIHAAQVECINDKFYLIGGFQNGASSNVIYTIDIDNNTIEAYAQTAPWTVTHGASVKIDNTIYCFGGGAGTFCRKECFAFTPYDQDTCVILLNNKGGSSKLANASIENTLIKGNIANIYKVTNGAVAEVTWTENGVIQVTAPIEYNLGAEEKKIRGYLKSNTFVTPPADIKIGAQGEYYETVTQLSALAADKGTDHCAVAYGKYIYIFGAWIPVAGSTQGTVTSTISKYDIETDTMTVLSTTLPNTISGCMGAVVRDKIYLIGGYSSTNGGAQKAIMVFDPATETITISEYTLPEVRLNGAVGVWGDDIYIIAGRHSIAYSSIVHFNPIGGIVETLDVALPQAVFYCGFAQSGSKVYVLGGRLDETSHTNLIQYFDYETMTTGTLDSTPETTQASTAIVIDNHIYFSGAHTTTAGKRENYWYKYNILTGELDNLGFKLQYGIPLGGFAAVDNILYTFGGQANSATTSNFTDAGYKYEFQMLAPYNCLFMHTGPRGQMCIPYKVNGIEIETQIKDIYKGNLDGFAERIADVTTYYNKKWLPIC